MSRYRINRHNEETACEFCGCPLYVGDLATDVDDGAAVVCSRSCERELQANRTPPKARPAPRTFYACEEDHFTPDIE